MKIIKRAYQRQHQRHEDYAGIATGTLLLINTRDDVVCMTED